MPGPSQLLCEISEGTIDTIETTIMNTDAGITKSSIIPTPITPTIATSSPKSSILTTTDQSVIDSDSLNQNPNPEAFSVFLDALFRQLNGSSLVNPSMNFQFSDILFATLNDTLDNVNEGTGESFSSFLFENLPVEETNV